MPQPSIDDSPRQVRESAPAPGAHGAPESVLALSNGNAGSRDALDEAQPSSSCGT